MADTISTKRITDLPEDTDVNDNDLFMAGSNGTASLRKKKWSTLLTKIKSVLLANNLTTTTAGYALDARQGKALKDQLDQQNTNLQYTTQTQTSPNGWYNLVLRKSGRIVTADGTMTLATSYNAGNVFFSIENTAYQNGGGTPLVFYNRTADTFHMCYITGNHEIQSVSPFTAGDYVICGTWITG